MDNMFSQRMEVWLILCLFCVRDTGGKCGKERSPGEGLEWLSPGPGICVVTGTPRMTADGLLAGLCPLLGLPSHTAVPQSGTRHVGDICTGLGSE